ncbi:hypothetical protein BDN72DRAFT_213600 [Pluteus cervinus]|uniref:Uncharacterized protein n=1 Tax=Pluteus cervinus TaxID=181527 RepID=A0ACD3B604_9AGAR|nr:hypothetical protein BDN72DRAFT_213600 [Pluteus cervinus]
MPPVNYETTIGAFEIGVLIAMFLFGVTTMQTFSYYRKFPADNRGMKIFVGVIWMLECLQSGLIANSLYWLTIKNYGQADAINQPLRALCFATILFAIITCSIQGFFTYRLHLLINSWVVPCICWSLSTSTFAGHIVVATFGLMSDSFLEWRNKWRVMISCLLVTSTTVDVLIAGCLTYRRWRRRRESLARHQPTTKVEEMNTDLCHTGATHKPVDKLIVWSLETCLATSTLMLLMLILFVSMNNFAWITVFFTISRLFSNSFLASLHGRESLRNDADEPLRFVDCDIRSSGSGLSHIPRPDSESSTAKLRMSTSFNTENDLNLTLAKDLAPLPRFPNPRDPRSYGRSRSTKAAAYMMSRRSMDI